MVHKRLNPQQEWKVGMSYLCGVSEEYVRQHWGVGKQTARIIVHQRLPQNDPLVTFYLGNYAAKMRYKNAIHMHLVNNFQEIPHTEWVILPKNCDVEEAVQEDIFTPRAKKLVRNDTKLDDILLFYQTELTKGLSPQELVLLRAIFGEKIGEDAYEIVLPMIYDELKKAFHQGKAVKPGDPLLFPIDRAYIDVKGRILKTLYEGYKLTQDKEVQQFVAERDEKRKVAMQEKIEEVLKTLEEREEEVLRLRFGLGGNDFPRTLEEVGTIFNVTQERVKHIEAKALNHLKHSSRRKKLIDFLE